VGCVFVTCEILVGGENLFLFCFVEGAVPVAGPRWWLEVLLRFDEGQLRGAACERFVSSLRILARRKLQVSVCLHLSLFLSFPI